MGLLTTFIGAIPERDFGDFLLKGFPFGYYNRVWGLGFGPPKFLVIPFVLDFVIWSVVWFAVIGVVLRFVKLKKKKLPPSV